MSKLPAMPIYWDSYISDTTHLTCEEHGAYLLLLAAMWRRNGSVPDCDRDNARILGLTVARWMKVKQRLAPMLIMHNDQITQKKLAEIFEKTLKKIATNSSNGARGGRPKSSKNKGLIKANAFDSLKPIKSIPDPDPYPDPYTPTAAAAHGSTSRGRQNRDGPENAQNASLIATNKNLVPKDQIPSKSSHSAKCGTNSTGLNPPHIPSITPGQSSAAVNVGGERQQQNCGIDTTPAVGDTDLVTNKGRWAQLMAAVGDQVANPAASPGILVTATPQRWLEAYDWTAIVIPTLTAWAARRREKNPRASPVTSWNYFANMLADAQAAADKTLPKGDSSRAKNKNRSNRSRSVEDQRRKIVEVLGLQTFDARAHADPGGGDR